jgi:hypothetical protein
MTQILNYALPKGETLEMIRYGTTEGKWDPNGPAAIAMFVVGVDLNTRSSQLNEELWDVVQPVKEFWHPEEGVADLMISYQNKEISLSLGQWLGRYPDGRLRPFADNRYISGTPDFGGFSETTLYDDLVALMRKHTRSFTSNTPEDILAQYVVQCVETFDKTVTDLHGSER